MFKLEMKRTVRKSAKTHIKKLVKCSGKNNFSRKWLAFKQNLVFRFRLYSQNFFCLAVQANVNSRKIEHFFKQFSVARYRHSLVGILKIAVVMADKNRHSSGHRRIDLLWCLSPLLHSIFQKHIFIHIFCNFF